MTKPMQGLVASLLVSIAIATIVGGQFIPYVLDDPKYFGHELDRAAPAFELTRLDGEAVDEASLRGRYTFAMFGFLACPTVCHPQAQILRELSRVLGDEAVDFVFITLDPANDTRSRLAAYFGADASRITVLRAHSQQQVQNVAREFGETVFREDRNGEALIRHAGRMYLIDSSGHIRLVYSGVGFAAAALAADWRQLVDKGA